MSGTWTKEEIAARLRARFHDGIVKADFARKHKIPGGASMLNQHIHAHKPVSVKAAAAYARAFGVPIGEINPEFAGLFQGDQGKDDLVLTGEHLSGVSPSRLPSLYSGRLGKIDFPQPTRAQILTEPLPERFVVVVEDESMAGPGHKWMSTGTRATFRPCTTAQPGDDVLISDADDNLYIRTYTQRSQHHWRAVPRNPNFEPLDSKADGLRIIGVLTGAEWG